MFKPVLLPSEVNTQQMLLISEAVKFYEVDILPDPDFGRLIFRECSCACAVIAPFGCMHTEPVAGKISSFVTLCHGWR